MSYLRPLDFEKVYLDLKSKLDELKSFAEEKHINLDSEIEAVEARIDSLNELQYQSLTAWQKYQLARHADRPTALEYIDAVFSEFVELFGDRLYGDDPSVIGGLAWLDDIPVTVLGHQKGKDTNQNIYRNFGMPHPEGYRKSCRLMRQAEKFGRPVICFIDTPGAYPGAQAEERGQAWAISQTLATMASLKVPTVSIIIGEGISGGALAFGVADRVLMMSYAVYSVISPHGCASILLNDLTRTEEMAENLKMTASDLIRLGIVDGIISEPMEGAHRQKERSFDLIGRIIRENVKELMDLDFLTLPESRYEKLRKIGVYTE